MLRQCICDNSIPTSDFPVISVLSFYSVFFDMLVFFLLSRLHAWMNLSDNEIYELFTTNADTRLDD